MWTGRKSKKRGKRKIMQRWFKGEEGENQEERKESALENTHIQASCTRYVGCKGCKGYSCRKKLHKITTVKINKGRDARTSIGGGKKQKAMTSVVVNECINNKQEKKNLQLMVP